MEQVTGDTQRRWMLWAGLSGIAASFFWIAGDMLIVGENARPEEYALLLVRYASQIDFGGLHAMLPASEPRLAAGALVAALTSSLYLVGAWHLFRVARPLGLGRIRPARLRLRQRTAWACRLLFCGHGLQNRAGGSRDGPSGASRSGQPLRPCSSHSLYRGGWRHRARSVAAGNPCRDRANALAALDGSCGQSGLAGDPRQCPSLADPAAGPHLARRRRHQHRHARPVRAFDLAYIPPVL
jgi:hypothetical protein